MFYATNEEIEQFAAEYCEMSNIKARDVSTNVLFDFGAVLCYNKFIGEREEKKGEKIMDKKCRVFYNKGDYKRCTELKNEFLPQGITEFPAYVVYDDCMGKWCEVSFKGFIDYLETMRYELQVQMNDIEWYLDLNDAKND